MLLKITKQFNKKLSATGRNCLWVLANLDHDSGLLLVKNKTMAQRRMFSLKIVDTDAFLDMPQSSQLLYFHLSMRADDDGFVGNPKKIMRVIGTNEDDMKVLLAKRFVLTFKSGVVVIKHWRIHNYIQSDRYTPTSYLEEKKQLFLNENQSYTDKEGYNNVYKMDTQVRLGKVSKGKNDSSFRKKAYYKGDEMRFSQNKWWVLPKGGGDWLEYAGSLNEIEWK